MGSQIRRFYLQDKWVYIELAWQWRASAICPQCYKRGQSYIALLTDFDHSRVVAEGRINETAAKLLESLSLEQKLEVQAVPMEMREPFIATAKTQVPDADIVHDKYHVSSYLNEAVDNVCRQEHKALKAQGDETLKGTRQLWLYNPQNFCQDQSSQSTRIKDMNLKVGRA